MFIFTQKSIALFTALTFTFCSYSQVDSIDQRIVLIGDAGELNASGNNLVIDWVKNHVDMDDEKTTVIYLGDNIYPLGMPPESDYTYPQSKKIIDYQIDLVKGKKAKAFFVPGNHDWKNGKLGGWQQVINEVDYINSQALPNVQASPTDGCPGPIEVQLSEKVVVALMDSQWWLYVHDKPGPESNCETRTPDEVITALQEIADSHPNQLLIVAMHHPMYSHGVHGGDYGWKHHIFPFTEYIHWLYIPLPVLGSIYPITRGVFGNLQDTKHPLYRSMIRQIEGVLRKHPYSMQVAGHDHGLQMLVKDSIPYIVSGSGSNLSRVNKGRFSVFADRDLGLSILEVRKSGKAQVNFYNIRSTGLSNPTFTKELKTIVPIIQNPPSDTLIKQQAYVIDTANPRLKANSFKEFFLGKNYRNEWTQPVKVPILNFATEMGGLTPTKKGGGKQTQSLRVVDTTGKEWALRSIKKFPEAAIPADLREAGLAKDIVEDGVSASYPYASLSVATLAKAAGVPYLRDTLVHIPNTWRLQRFRQDFKDMLAMMEERKPEGVKKVYNSDELVLRLAKDNDDHVNQKAVLKARLLDNFIMDFDRHEGQWSWATYDTGKGKMYYPIPKDRDQAFFTNQGLIPHFVKSSWLVPELQGFKAKADNIKTFNRPARNFDRTFLTELSEDEWSRQIDTFLTTMTDSVITASLMRQPVEVQKYSTAQIINTLKKRREYFKKDMMKYYKFLSKMVSIIGSNQKEQFTITKNDDGSVRVVVNKIDKSGEVSSKIYDRLFDPKVTKELRIYGLEGKDKFIVEGGRTRIKIRIIGGPGKDEYINNAKGGKTIVYDAVTEQKAGSFSGNVSGFTKKISKDPLVNQYNRLNFKYDNISPGVSVAYNIDDGIYLGVKFEMTKQGFRKDPYSFHQTFLANRALQTSSYHFRYDAELIKLIGNNDLLIKSDFKAPINVTNFFGMGNNTTKTLDHQEGIKYYRTRYNIIDASVLLRRQMQSWMRINYGPAFEYFVLDQKENKGKFVTNTALSHLDMATLYKSKSYLGGVVYLDIDSRNNKVLPSRGFVLNAGIRPLFGLNSYSHNVTQLNWDMKVYISKSAETKIVFATRLGVGHNIGDFEFQQAQYLGGTENLRGFRKQRFAGRTMFFNNSEIRYKLADFNTYLFPGAIGLQVFNDIGRVWADKENSKTWHDGYGVGVWLAPVRRYVFTASIAHSKEEKVWPLLTFGFQF